MNAYKELRIADIEKKEKYDIKLEGYQLTGSQLFIKNLFNPNTSYKRLLINWQTGVGKSIASIAIANEFIKQFQERYRLGEKKPHIVCILGFSTSETIQADLIKYPELGYVTEKEVKELNKLILENDPRHVQVSANIHRRLVDKSTGGYYKFFGYREFVNNIFIITDKGLVHNFSLQDLFIENEDNNIDKYVKLEYIKLNLSLINLLEDGLIIADEIHNVYNSLEINNYGFAIQYVLSYLKNNAPRVILMSATPLTGNASEVIDLLNLLNPNSFLKKSDYFHKDSEGIYQLKPHTLSEVTKLTTGKISFLIDTDIDLYPERIFIGENINGVPYIKINVCEIPIFYVEAINKERETTENITIQSYTLYDMVFPNPLSTEYGLYNNVVNVLQNASSEWRRSNNIDIYSIEGVPIITGSFLYKENLKKYSMKYYNVLNDIIDNIKQKDKGKIMIYHHRVQISGVLLIQEMFKYNGFVDDISEPNNNTLCVLCGIILLHHTDNDHIFKPCRFIMAHSKINKATMKTNLVKFNDVSNLYGEEYKLLIGSRIIREGLNFKAIKYQYIMSLPINFPILIQVLGRVVRKNSHIDLPKDEQKVYIKIYANEIEVPRYVNKAKEYLIIQEVEKALRINAVDNFINYKNLQFDKDTLESLKFTPSNIEKPSIISKYFDAYNYNDDEILLLKRLINLLFTKQSVWTYDDLWYNIKNNIGNINYNIDLISQENFDIALNDTNLINVNNVYHIQSDEYDIECFFKKKREEEKISINLNKLYSKSVNKMFIVLLSIYDKYIDNIIEMSLLELPSFFHIELLKQLVTKKKNITSNDDLVIDMYYRFRILIKNNNIPIGYISKIAINLFNFEKNEWYNEPHDIHNISKRFDENNTIIGYVVDDKESSKFKIREPINVNKIKQKDMRVIKTGMLCENYTRPNLIKILYNIRKINNDKINYAYKYDNSLSGKLSIAELCYIIKLYMLYFEESNRLSINGMKYGIRWVYLFHDNMPIMKTI